MSLLTKTKDWISQASRTFYVDKDATGSGSGASWTNAYTSIQTAVDTILHDVVLRDEYYIYVRSGAKKTGTADANILNKLHDTGEFPATTTWVGRRVFNIDGTGPGDNWGVISARDSDDQLSIVDQVTGAALDLFPNGNENYVIEPTPYRETLTIHGLNYQELWLLAEYYWRGDCDANVNVGEIVDATADFSNVQVGDRVYVWDLNGAGGRMQNRVVGTVDDISMVGANIVRTNLAVTPTTNWGYTIVRAEWSGSDDGTDAGTARNNIIYMDNARTLRAEGFYLTFADTYAIQGFAYARGYFSAIIMENVDGGIYGLDYCQFDTFYCYIQSTVNQCLVGIVYSALGNFYVGLKGVVGQPITSCDKAGYIELAYFYMGTGTNGIWAGPSAPSSSGNLFWGTIENTVTNGIVAAYAGAVRSAVVTNNAIVPLTPAAAGDPSWCV